MILRDDNEKYNIKTKSYIFENDISEDNIFFESSYVVLGTVSECKKIVANYNLIVFGDIEADSIDIKGNLLVFGNVKCNELNVGGNFECKHDLSANTVMIGQTMTVKRLQTDHTIIQKDLYIQSAFVNKTLEVNGNIICSEGIIGEGKCISKNIIIKEYYHIDMIAEELVLIDQIKNIEDNEGISFLEFDIEKLFEENIFNNPDLLINISKTQLEINRRVSEEFENYIAVIEDSLDYDDIFQELQKISKDNPVLERIKELYGHVLRFSEVNKVSSVEEFIALLTLKRETPKFLYKISLVEDVLNNFFEIQKGRFPELDIKYSESDLVIQNLYFLNQNRHLITNDGYENLKKKLISHLK